MKNKRLNISENNFLPIIEAAVLFLLLFLKLFFFEKSMNYGSFTLPISLVTVFIVVFIYTLLYCIFKKAPSAYLFVIYFILSLIILIDALYFSYFGKLPSVASLSSTAYLGGVTESIKNLLSFKVLVYVLDLPLIIVYLNMFRDKLSFLCDVPFDLRQSYKRITKWSLAILSFAILFAALVLGAVLNFKIRYLKNELIIFHTSDIYTVCFAKNNEFEIGDDYYGSASADISEDKYYGIAKGKNVITLQVEALQNFVIGMEIDGQEITPNLNALINNDTLYFDNYYYVVGGGNTADAEYAINNSLYSPETEAAYVKYTDNKYYGLPYILKDNGYSGAYAFHAYLADYWNREAAYVNQGFDDYHSLEDLISDDIVGMGISDASFFKQTVDIMSEYEQPFYSFLISLSSHYPYQIPAELCTLNLNSELYGTYVGNYLQSIHYVDYCIGLFIQYLKEADLYNNSIITIYGDHFGVLNDAENNKAMTKLLGSFYYEDDIFNVPMIIHIPGMGFNEKISTAMGHIDYLPTLLHLLSYKNNKSVMFGNDIFITPDNIVYEQMHVSRGSFITNDIFFVYPRNGIYTNTKIFNKTDGSLIELKPEYEDIAQAAIEEYEKCMYILDNDLVVNEDSVESTKETEQIFAQDVYYGIAEGKNVINIQVEALQNFVIGLDYDGQVITPNLNELLNKDTIYFENYYYVVGGGNTADAEFSINNSLYSPEAEAAYVKYANNTYYGLPYILKDNGYSGAYAFHGYDAQYWNREAAYVNQGFDKYYSSDDFVLDDIVGMGLSDSSFFRQSADIMSEFEQPFYSFLITLSSHYPGIMPSELREMKLPYGKISNDMYNYLHSIHYVDKCIGEFIQHLKDNGLYENSIICIYGDHFGMVNDAENHKCMGELLGKDYYEEEIFNVPMIIHIPGSGINETISTVGSHVDYLPTVLHLLSYENKKSIMFGNDLFTTPDNVVYEQMHVARGSFINDEIFLVYPVNGIFENTVVFNTTDGSRLELKAEYEDTIDSAIDEYNRCMYVLDNDLVVKK